MQSIRRALFAVTAFLSVALPASAQTTMSGAPAGDSGNSLIMVWVWILVAGITIFIIGTCSGVRSGK